MSVHEAKARVAVLNDAEARDLAARIDHAPSGAGGNPAAVVMLPVYLLIGIVRVLGLVLSLALGGR